MANPQQQADDIYPLDFASWHHCIAVKCGVPLSADYVAERIAVLTDPGAEETQRFVRLYGEAWHQQVLTWFRLAASGN